MIIVSMPCVECGTLFPVTLGSRKIHRVMTAGELRCRACRVDGRRSLHMAPLVLKVWARDVHSLDSECR